MAAQDAPLQVGLAEIDITPPVGYRMDGYFYERLNTGQRDPLMAKALVLQQGTTRAALVVCDLLGMPQSMSSDVRRLAAGADRHSRRRTSPSPPRIRTPGRCSPASGRGCSANRQRRSSATTRSRR